MRKGIYLFALVILAMGWYAGRARAQAQTPLVSGFDSLKSLAGTWEAREPQGKTVTNIIRLVSNGTALEETSESSGEDQMVTLYTPNGKGLAMTHYCAAGNQPRMEAPAITGDQKDFDFSLTGITNLANPNAGHMRHLLIQVADQDHFTEKWTWRENGKDVVRTIHFKRTKT
jgi:hypothetical protein